MKDVKHTPGPWSADIYNGEEMYSVMADYSSAQKVEIANVHLIYSRREETIVNAQLIAAAPELLEWLEDAIDVCEGQSDSGEPGLINIAAARAVIARAKGEETP